MTLAQLANMERPSSWFLCCLTSSGIPIYNISSHKVVGNSFSNQNNEILVRYHMVRVNTSQGNEVTNIIRISEDDTYPICGNNHKIVFRGGIVDFAQVVEFMCQER